MTKFAKFGKMNFLHALNGRATFQINFAYQFDRETSKIGMFFGISRSKNDYNSLSPLGSKPGKLIPRGGINVNFNHFFKQK